MTATETATLFPCPRCGYMLRLGTLVCPNCGGLVYAERLNQLAAEAQQEETVNPVRAASIWQQALTMLPPDSQQHQMVASRIGALTSQLGSPPTLPYQPRQPPRSDPWHIALLKTGGSMIISIFAYALIFSGNQGLTFGLLFATGFVLLILVHELGHVVAMRYFGLSASPPIFIPFLGALINLRQPPRNALEESVVGIGGPVTGTLAAGACFLLYMYTGQLLFLPLAYFGFLLNLFNMLPVPPLDGGRVTAAVSPWIWIPGLLGAVAWLIKGWRENGSPSFILILLLLYAWPRVRAVIAGRGRLGDYYKISRRASWAMGAAYVVLGLSLIVLKAVARNEIRSRLPIGVFDI